MKAYGGVDVYKYSHRFVTPALVSEWSDSRPTALLPRKDPRYPLDMRLGVTQETCLDYVEKREFLPIPGLELRSLGLPARSQLLYRLRYPNFPCKPTEYTSFIHYAYHITRESQFQIHDSVGSRSACASSEAGFSSQNGDRAWELYYRRAAFCCALLWAKGLSAKNIHQ
jgi:hypothetical protein